MIQKLKDKLSTLACSAIMLSLPFSQKLYAQSSTNSLVGYITGNGWLASIIQISIIIVAAFEIMKELPKLLAGEGVFKSLATIGAWLAIAIWWDDIIIQLTQQSAGQGFTGGK